MVHCRQAVHRGVIPDKSLTLDLVLLAVLLNGRAWFAVPHLRAIVVRLVLFDEVNCFLDRGVGFSTDLEGECEWAIDWAQRALQLSPFDSWKFIAYRRLVLAASSWRATTQSGDLQAAIRCPVDHADRRHIDASQGRKGQSDAQSQ